MRFNCRLYACLAAIMLLAVPSIGAAQSAPAGTAQPYPNRPVRIIVCFPPGSSPDIIARIVSNKLTSQWGQQMIVDTRPGATGIIGVEAAKNATPDGYTLLLAGATELASMPALRSKLPYDADKDFVALTRVASVAYVIAVHPSLGVNAVSDLVKLAKARPGQLNYGSSGNGSGTHIGAEMFNVLGGVKTMHVPYKGASLAITDLIVGQIQFIVASPIFVTPHAKSGRIKMIATTGATRDSFLPDLPAAAETLPGFEIGLWWGISVPAKTPAAIAKTLHGEIVKATQSTDVREQLARQGAATHAESPAEYAAFIKAERERIARIGRRVGISLD